MASRRWPAFSSTQAGRPQIDIAVFSGIWQTSGLVGEDEIDDYEAHCLVNYIKLSNTWIRHLEPIWKHNPKENNAAEDSAGIYHFYNGIALTLSIIDWLVETVVFTNV